MKSPAQFVVRWTRHLQSHLLKLMESFASKAEICIAASASATTGKFNKDVIIKSLAPLPKKIGSLSNVESCLLLKRIIGWLFLHELSLSMRWSILCLNESG